MIDSGSVAVPAVMLSCGRIGEHPRESILGTRLAEFIVSAVSFSFFLLVVCSVLCFVFIFLLLKKYYYNKVLYIVVVASSSSPE